MFAIWLLAQVADRESPSMLPESRRDREPWVRQAAQEAIVYIEKMEKK